MPLIVVSPWAKANYVSSVVQDHTSITAFIERKWNLPAMTFRDANAHPMTTTSTSRKPAFAERAEAGRQPRGWPPGWRSARRTGLDAAAVDEHGSASRRAGTRRYSAVPPASPGRGSGRGASGRARSAGGAA